MSTVRVRLRSVALIVWAAGCASYTAGAAPVATSATTPARKTEGVVTVGADPYVQRDQQRAVFGAALTEQGVLAIQVVVENRGDRSLLVRPSDMRLVLADGGQMSPAGPTAVASRLEKADSHTAATVFGGVLGYFAAVQASDKASADRLADYRSKQLGDLTLDRGDSGAGFVYFIAPPGRPPSARGVLRVRFVDPQKATSFVVDVELDGLDWKAVRAR